MKLFAFSFDGEEKCKHCNWKVYNLFVLADSMKEAKSLLRRGFAGLCGECMCELLSAEKYEIKRKERI